jgi:LmbE family N-acetylglucosaminyl deacetylase
LTVTALIERIASGRGVADRIALVVAHPDDETLGLGGTLSSLRRLTLIHLTDGSPRHPADARRSGFADRESYAAARRHELDAALVAMKASVASRIAYDVPDQESIEHVDAIVERLEADLDGIDAVITHPYEHGHPDHDTAALGVALACRRRASQGRRVPQRLEFASYHLRLGRVALGVFWPDPARPERRLALDETAIAAKRAAIACHASQRGVFPDFPLSPERLREAPDYDFDAPAPPRDSVYDRLGWDMTSARWRAAAALAWRGAPLHAAEEPWSRRQAFTAAR